MVTYMFDQKLEQGDSGWRQEKVMTRAVPRDMPFPSPGRPNITKQCRSRIMKLFNRMNSRDNTQWAFLMVDSKGKATVDTSEAFKGCQDIWFPDHVIKEASVIAVATASEVRARIRSEAEQNGHQPGGKPGAGDAAIEEDDELEDDAEHEDEDGPNSRLDGANEESPFQKNPLHYPDPPASLFGVTARIRKRTLQTAQLAKMKRRKSSVKPMPAQRSDGESNAVTAPGGVTYKALLISDVDAVTTFFETRFRQMQQLTCKVVAKAWIKVIEPKKQSNYPYNRGEESKPSWWPEGARHKEPDHLMKPERLLLLMTMLRCRRVPIAKLEIATQEVAASIEECRIGLLEEIYRVAKMEERYVAGTLPPSSYCYVAASAEKIVSNQKPQSQSPKAAPSSAERSEVSPPESGGPGPGRSNSVDMQAHRTSRLSPTDVAAPARHHSISFPTVSRSTPNIQPALHGQTIFNSSFLGSAPGNEEGYMEPTRTVVPNYYFRYGQPSTAPPTIRRANSISQPQMTQSQYSGWPVQVGGLFSTYNSPAQPQSQHAHHTPHGPHSLGGSNPTTPVTSASYQPMGLLPPPLPPIQQHQPHSSLGPSHVAVTVPGDRTTQYDSSRIGPHMNHPNVSFSEFLESPMPDLGPPPNVGEEDIVGLGGTGRGQEQNSGMPGIKQEMPHD